MNYLFPYSEPAQGKKQDTNDPILINYCILFRSCSGGTGSPNYEEAAGCTMSDTNVPYEMEYGGASTERVGLKQVK